MANQEDKAKNISTSLTWRGWVLVVAGAIGFFITLANIFQSGIESYFSLQTMLISIGLFIWGSKETKK